jgi:hypothetical protein
MRMDEQSAELDGVRIRQLAAGRRAAIRLRTYLLVGMIGCLVSAAQSIILAILAVRIGDWLKTALWIALAIPLLCAACWLLRKLRHLAQQLHPPTSTTPLPPPDFGPLSDGSQHWKNLER